MYKRFCVKCGREITGEKTLCDECSGAKQIKKKRNLKICSICGKLKYKNKEFSSEEELLNYISREFKGSAKISGDKIIITNSLEIIELFLIESNYICSECKKYANPRSYNYKIQLRGNKNKVYEVARMIIKKYPPVNIKELPEGIDLFFKINNLEFKKILKMIRNFTSNIKITRKLVTYDKQSSKKIYRVTIAVWF